MSLDRLDLHLHADRSDDAFHRTVLQQFDKIAELQRQFQLSVQQKLDDILTRLGNIKTQESSIMSTVNDTLAFVSELNDETNTLAVKVDTQTSTIDALKAQIAAGTPVSQEQLDQINAGLSPISARLRALGADAAVPIPPPAEPVA